MKKTIKLMTLLLAGVMIIQPMLAMAGQGARLIPNGNVSLVKDGSEVTRFTSEMPLPDGLLMVASGSAVVQTNGLQLVAHDQALFGLSEGDRWNVTVKSGRVDFALRSDAKLVTFNTPQESIRSESLIVPASSDGLVRGYVVVTDNGTELHVTDGGMQLATAEGSQMVQAGNGIVLASATTTESVASGADTSVVASGEGMSPLMIGGIVAGGTAIVLGSLWAAGVFDDDDDDDDDDRFFFRRGDRDDLEGRPLRRLVRIAVPVIVLRAIMNNRPDISNFTPNPLVIAAIRWLITHRDELPPLPRPT